jgi:transcriptional regulator with XRE-family HTH domain
MDSCKEIPVSKDKNLTDICMNQSPKEVVKVSSRTSPTVRRRRLASLMRKLREEAGKSKDEAAAHAGTAPRTITRIEAAEHNPSPSVIAMLGGFYELPPDQVADLVTLCRESRKKGWWHSYGSAIPEWFQVYIGLEEEVSELRTYQPEVVVGLLQTEGYVRAMMLADVNVPSEGELEQRVAVRLKRQERLAGEDAAKLWVVLNEAVLHRQVGGREVMREQLQHMIAMSRRNNVVLQVLPFTSGAHPGNDGAFEILGFPEPADPAVVYLQNRLGSVFMEQPGDVARYTEIFDHLRVEALSQDDSRALMARIADEMS